MGPRAYRERTNHVRLLVVGERVHEELGLVIMLLELFAPYALLDAGNLLSELEVAAMVRRDRWSGVEAVRPVVNLTFVDVMVHLAVAVEVHDGANGTIDGQLLPVHSETRDLSVEVATTG